MADADQIGQRIVVVDDERNIRRTLSMVLEGEGYAVETFESAEDFLPRLSGGPIDVLMLDVRLPGMDGLETLEKIREENTDLPVLMISGHATLEEAVRAMAIGATDFLEKPLSRERVLVTVQNAIEKRALNARVRALEAQEGGDEEMLGSSPAIQKVKQQIREGRGHRRPRPDHRRVRHRQGAGGSRGPPGVQARQRPVREGQTARRSRAS